jgi:hypothetical protein
VPEAAALKRWHAFEAAVAERGGAVWTSAERNRILVVQVHADLIYYYSLNYAQISD